MWARKGTLKDSGNQKESLQDSRPCHTADSWDESGMLEEEEDGLNFPLVKAGSGGTVGRL